MKTPFMRMSGLGKGLTWLQNRGSPYREDLPEDLARRVIDHYRDGNMNLSRRYDLSLESYENYC